MDAIKDRLNQLAGDYERAIKSTLEDDVYDTPERASKG